MAEEDNSDTCEGAAALAQSRNYDRADSYEDQLKSLFLSCDQWGRHRLGRNGLAELCSKLQLSDQQSDQLIRQLLKGRGQVGEVTFETFKEGLVAFLEGLSVGSIGEDSESSPNRSGLKTNNSETGRDFRLSEDRTVDDSPGIDSAQLQQRVGLNN